MGEGTEGYWEQEKRMTCVEGERGERERNVKGSGRILRSGDASPHELVTTTLYFSS